MEILTVDKLIEVAIDFSNKISSENHIELLGVTDGKAVGTYVEHRFKEYLLEYFTFKQGNSAKGIDLPNLLSIGGIKEDIIALLEDRSVPGDELVYNDLAEEIMENPPIQGYLTISNALQWRLQYRRVISLDNKIDGVINFDW